MEAPSASSPKGSSLSRERRVQRYFENRAYRPEVIGNPGSHGWRAQNAGSGETWHASLKRVIRSDKMIEGSPPLAMQAKMVGRLGERPGLAHERSDAAANGEIDSLNICGLNISTETLVREQLIEDLARPVWSKKPIRPGIRDYAALR